MDWKSIIKSVAPMIGTALGGPLAGTAVKFLSNELLGTDEAGEAELRDVILSASPETLAKVKELDYTFKTRMRELGIEEEQLYAKDRGDARAMAQKTTLIPQMVISTIFIAAFTTVLYMVFNKVLSLDETQKTIMIYLLGILSAGMTQVMNFWFGSSSGSKEKDAKIKL